MNKNLIFIVGAIILLGLGYFLFMNNQQAPTADIDVEIPEVTTQTETLILAEQNESGEAGVATLVEENGMVKVTLTMTGAPEGVSQPAHIHMGVCPDVGEVVYPLTNVVDGVSETTLNVTMDQLRSEEPLAINVHKSVSESGVYVSCGDLEL